MTIAIQLNGELDYYKSLEEVFDEYDLDKSKMESIADAVDLKFVSDKFKDAKIKLEDQYLLKYIELDGNKTEMTFDFHIEAEEYFQDLMDRTNKKYQRNNTEEWACSDEETLPRSITLFETNIQGEVTYLKGCSLEMKLIEPNIKFI